jgi:hypothetical protein
VTGSGSESGRGNREERVAALLAVAAALRERVLDEHMYAVDRGQHCPDEAEPPIWIDRLLFPWRDDEWLTVALFPVTGPYQLGEPRGRTRITVPEIARLLGIPPDISRGAGFRPRPPAPEPLLRYSTEWVLRIPRPVPFRNRRCMPPRRPWWRDALRQLAPQHTGRDCCWMDQGN